MARHERDYRAEYASRIERGEVQGFSRSQSRGHPRKHEDYISVWPAIIVLRRLRQQRGLGPIRRMNAVRRRHGRPPIEI